MVRRFLSCSSGAVAISTAILLVALIGISGLGVEVGRWYQLRRSMQGIADAAAISAVWSHDGTGFSCSSGSLGTSCTADAGFHGLAVATEGNWFYTPTNGVSVRVFSPPESPSKLAGDLNAVEVLIQQPQPLLFGRVFSVLGSSTDPVTVKAFSVAKRLLIASAAGNNCILALANAADAVQVRGIGNLSAMCGVSVDGGRAQNANGSPLGGITFKGDNAELHVTSLIVSAPSTSCPDTNPKKQHCFSFDPYYGSLSNVVTNATTRDPYKLRPCDEDEEPLANGLCGRYFDRSLAVTNPDGSCVQWTGTPTPGVAYCSINLGGTGTTVFPSGVYYIFGGDAGCVGFCVSGGGAVVRSEPGGVTFVLTNGTGKGSPINSYARLKITTGDIELTALPKTDTSTTHGLIFFQDPEATESLGQNGAPWGLSLDPLEVTILNGGSGYTPGTQTFTVPNDNGAPATFTATVDASGVVTSIVAVTTRGNYTAPPASPGTATSSDGSGTGALFQFTFQSLVDNHIGGAGNDGKRYLSGVLYFPKQNVSLTGNGPLTGECVGVVAKYLDVGGNPLFRNDGCLPGSGVDPIPVLITQPVLLE